MTFVAPAAPAPAPPKGFRKAIPVGVKLSAALQLLGLDPSQIEWDHVPPLHLREWDPVAQDTIPPANDPSHIFPRLTADHRAKTAKVDVPAIAKTRRLAPEQEAFRAKILAKKPGKGREKKGSIPSRPFPKRKKEVRR